MHAPVHTVGHSNRTGAELVALLEAAGVGYVVDVRRYPSSRRHPQFNRPALAAAFAAAGLGYTHVEVLGGHRPDPDDDGPFAGLDPAWRGYAAHMQTAAYREALDDLVTLAAAGPAVVVMCAERDPARCHRHLLADALVARGVPVVHLLAPGEVAPHRLHPLARVDAATGRIAWPARQGALL